MKQALLFTLSFVGISLVLTWLWLSGGNALYAEVMQPVARAFNHAIGLPRAGTMGRARFINLVPFTALMLLTPRLSLRRRFGGLALGLLVLAASHLVLNALAVASRSRGRLPPTAALASDAMPFLIWFVVARAFVTQTLQRARRGEAGRPPRNDRASDVEPDRGDPPDA